MKKAILALAVLCFLYVLYEYLTLPDVSALRHENPSKTMLMVQRDEEAKTQGRKPRRNQSWVPLASIPDYLIAAVLIGEDDAFYQHEGYDVNQIKESLIRDWEKKGFVRGGSTITQQLAKNLYLSSSKTPFRKVKEFLIARRLEEELSKRRILEIYLNVIEWGDGIYGVEAASRFYFSEPASNLGIQEAVLLAAVIPNPRRMNPKRPNQRVLFRFNMILDRMHQYKHIDDKQYRQAQLHIAVD
ncbi:MAG: monofunctional biosynthetic peptidoglycan transglycosylase [Terriglobia bacterium]